MPLPAYHLAAGLPLLSSRRTFIAYVATNLLIDVEVLFGMAMRDGLPRLYADIPLHGAWHTLPFVLLLAAVVRIWSKGPVFWGVLAGGVTHVVLDSIVHPDVWPLLFTDWSPLYGLLSWGETEALCLGLGATAFLLVDPVRGKLVRRCSGLAKRLRFRKGAA